MTGNVPRTNEHMRQKNEMDMIFIDKTVPNLLVSNCSRNYRHQVDIDSLKHTSQGETPGNSVDDWLPPLPKAIPILTSGVDTNEYRSAVPSRIGVTRSCKNNGND
jgi:hypothetical protein